jgi:protein-L-isoaspartate(D-aspartate) O-methyltransferase
VGAHDISPAWRAQLAPGGRLVLPLALPAVQASIAFDERDGGLESVSVRGCIFMRLRGAAAVPMRRVSVGPDPAPAVWPRGDHTVDGAAVYAFLQTPGHDLPTDLIARQDELYDGLVGWLGLHEPTSAWFIAQGDAVATSLVPPFVNDSAEAASTYGFFERGGVALLVRTAATPTAADSSISIGVRVHGDAVVGERLKAATVAWSDAGRPSLPGLRIRVYPVADPYEPRADEIMILRPCTRLVLDWPSSSQASGALFSECLGGPSPDRRQ